MTGTAKYNNRELIASKRARNRKKKMNRLNRQVERGDVINENWENHPQPFGSSSVHVIIDGAKKLNMEQNLHLERGLIMDKELNQSFVLEQHDAPINEETDDVEKIISPSLQLNLQHQQDDLGIVFIHQHSQTTFCTLFYPYDKWKNAKSCDKMSSSVFSIEIPTFSNKEDGVTMYTIRIYMQARIFEIDRRFSDFCRLAEALEENNIVKEWKLPPKTWFRPTDIQFLKERQIGLRNSMNELLKVSTLCRLPLVRDFLQLDVFEMQVNFEST